MRRFWNSFLAMLLLLLMAGVALGQSPAAPPVKTAVVARGLVAEFYMPANAQGTLPALIVLGGSRGGMDERSAEEAKLLSEHGYAALHLAYFFAPGLPTVAQLIPLEYFKSAIDWLSGQPGVDPDRIGIMGTSYGGMAALLVAAHYSDIKVVVAAVPSSVVWPGFSTPPQSIFTLAGQPLPHLPFGMGGGPRIYDLYDDGLNALSRHDDATIPAERINGPVLLICGKLDSLWPSCRMSAQVRARLTARKFQHTIELLEYADAGHAAFGPPIAPNASGFALLANTGGSPAGNNAARVDSWPKSVAFIDAALKPGSGLRR